MLAHIPNSRLRRVRLRRRKQVIVLNRIRNVRFRKILQQRLACCEMRAGGITFKTPPDENCCCVVGSKIGGSPAAEKSPARSASVGTVAYSSSGFELRDPDSVRNTVSLPLGFVSPGMYGALINVSPNRFVPEAGCSCDCPRRLNGSAFSAELLPIQKIAPCGWPGLKPRKFPRPPAATPATATKASAPNPPPNPPAQIRRRQTTLRPDPPPLNPPCARIVSIASRRRSISTPASGLTEPDCPLMATDWSLKSEFPAIEGNAAPLAPAASTLRLRISGQRAHQVQRLRAIARQLPNRLRHLSCLRILALLLLRRARSEHQLKIDRLVVARSIEQRFLRTLRKRRKLRANHVPPVLRNRQRPRAGHIRRRRISLACERVLRRDRDARQRNRAALHVSVKLAAGDRRLCVRSAQEMVDATVAEAGSATRAGACGGAERLCARANAGDLHTPPRRQPAVLLLASSMLPHSNLYSDRRAAHHQGLRQKILRRRHVNDHSGTCAQPTENQRLSARPQSSCLLLGLHAWLLPVISSAISACAPRDAMFTLTPITQW